MAIWQLAWGEACMETEPTEPGGFLLEGAGGDDSGNMCVFVCGNALHRLALVGLPAKTPSTPRSLQASGAAAVPR